MCVKQIMNQLVADTAASRNNPTPNNELVDVSLEIGHIHLDTLTTKLRTPSLQSPVVRSGPVNPRASEQRQLPQQLT